MVDCTKRRAAVVSGAAMGQGADAAKMLAREGYAVGLLDVSAEELQMVLEEIRREGGCCRSYVCDVSDREQVEDCVLELESRFGPVWVGACAAGILPAGGFTVETDETDWHRVIDVNLFGTVNVSRICARSMMRAKEGGRIVHWSSLNAVLTAPGYAPYAASKAAVEMFSRCFALEMAPYGITVNCIRPGSIETPMMFDMTGQDYMQEAKRIHLGRWGKPKDTTAVLKALLSREMDWITGTTITVDGGALACSGIPDLESIKLRMERRRNEGMNKKRNDRD
ncbi:MAG: SDR family oxidoreductase [Lachnospiraceae bacterium]|nr:SDR family oxidoreductase [Lachnospiraceae bacterium]